MGGMVQALTARQQTASRPATGTAVTALTTPPTAPVTARASRGELPRGEREDLSFVGPCFANSPLDVAIKRHHMEAVQMLISAGADVNSCDKFGNTPLHTACRLGDGVMVKLLLAGKADAVAINKKGLTPLQVVLSSTHREPSILKALRRQLPSSEVTP